MSTPQVPALHLLLGRDDTSLPQLWAARVASTPDRTFLRWQTTTWTYAQAWLEIRRFAGYPESLLKHVRL